ncbi:MAG: hypothetical protein LUB59_06080 [Candidatus Gastranaerophilales bacterium]|nr:hypothetical protein [Candidatus Gastranaerophilales bacterium]
MQIRTFFRIMFNNIIRDNIFVRVISSIVNFCCELDVMNYKSLKYNKEMPLTMEDTKKNIFFQSIGGDRIDCK